MIFSERIAKCIDGAEGVEGYTPVDDDGWLDLILEDYGQLFVHRAEIPYNNGRSRKLYVKRRR